MKRKPGAGTVELDDRNNGGSSDAANRGLLKLMLRLPSMRGRLQILVSHSAALRELCEAYGEASAALEKLEKVRPAPDVGLLDEYRTICAEIEADVIRYCLDHRDTATK